MQNAQNVFKYYFDIVIKERVAAVSVLLGYDAVSQGNWIAAFRSNIVYSSSRDQMSRK